MTELEISLERFGEDTVDEIVAEIKRKRLLRQEH